MEVGDTPGLFNVLVIIRTLRHPMQLLRICATTTPHEGHSEMGMTESAESTRWDRDATLHQGDATYKNYNIHHPGYLRSMLIVQGTAWTDTAQP